MKYLPLSLLILLAGVQLSFAQQRVYKTDNFLIHYDSSDVPSNKDHRYTSLQAKHTTAAVPYYIQDMGLYLQTAFDKYVSLGITAKMQEAEFYEHEVKEKKAAPTLLKIFIYVEDIKDANGKSIDGETSSTSIKINTLVPPERGMSTALALQKTCTHELLHYVTMKHYSLVAAGMATKWWWEALAVQADRLVFPNNKPYEAEQYAGESSQNLSFVLHRSWDDCNEEPNWYTAGGFLSYLLYYRPGAHADFKEFFFRPTQNKTSYTRTVLDTYVKELGAVSIGREYHNYIKWCYDNKGFAAIDTSPAALAGNAHTQLIRLDEKFTADTVTTTIPYMAAKIYRLKNMEIKKKTIIVKNNTQSENVLMYVYSCIPGSRKELMTLRSALTGDSLIFHYQDKRQWLDIVSINASNGETATASLIVIDAVMAEGDYKGKVEFGDDNSKIKSKYSITLSDLHIIIDEKNQATGSIEFHMEYPKDGMLAECTDFQGRVDAYGNFILKGRVKETSFPKCKEGCCTFELIKQGSPCMKATKYLYWHFTGKVKITAIQKEIEGNIIVSQSAQMPKGDKAMLKYAVSTN